MYLTQTGYAKKVRTVEIQNLKHIVDGDGVHEEYPSPERQNVPPLIYSIITGAFLAAGSIVEFLYPSLIILAVGMAWSGFWCWDTCKAVKLLDNTCWHTGKLRGWSITLWVGFLAIVFYAFWVLVKAQEAGAFS